MSAASTGEDGAPAISSIFRAAAAGLRLLLRRSDREDDLGGRPSTVAAMIESDPPPMPACYPSLKEWKGWLLDAHRSGERIARISDTGGRSGSERVRRWVFTEIDHCVDCTPEHRAWMEREGRCRPFVGTVTKAHQSITVPQESGAEPLVAAPMVTGKVSPESVAKPEVAKTVATGNAATEIPTSIPSQE